MGYGTLSAIAAALQGREAYKDKMRARGIEDERTALANDLARRQQLQQDRTAEQWAITNTPADTLLPEAAATRRNELYPGFVAQKPARPATLDSLGPTTGDPWGKMSLPEPSISPGKPAGLYSVPTESEKLRLQESKDAAAFTRTQALSDKKRQLQNDKLLVDMQIAQLRQTGLNDRQQAVLEQNAQRIANEIARTEAMISNQKATLDERRYVNDSTNAYRAAKLQADANKSKFDLSSLFSQTAPVVPQVPQGPAAPTFTPPTRPSTANPPAASAPPIPADPTQIKPNTIYGKYAADGTLIGTYQLSPDGKKLVLVK